MYAAKEKMTNIALNEFGEVDVPDLESDGEGEELDASLVDLEGLLEILVLLQEGRVVDDDLRSSHASARRRDATGEGTTDLSIGDAELEDAVVDVLGRLHRADRLLEIDVEGPELDRLEQSLLDRKRL